MEKALEKLARAKRNLKQAREAGSAAKFDPDNLTEAEAMGALLAWMDGAELLLDRAISTLTATWGGQRP